LEHAAALRTASYGAYPSPRGVRLHGGAVYSILSFITEKAFSVIGGDKGNASFFGCAAFTPYMVFGIEGI
jgi:hypothetical protein